MARPATGAVVPTKAGGWALRFTAYGKRRYTTLTPADAWTLDQAEAELQNVMADVRRGTWRPPNPAVESAPAPTDDPTFHEFASEWFENARFGRKQSTVDGIAWRLSYVLLPYFQHHRLSQVTVQEVDRYVVAQVRERDRLIAAQERGEKIDRKPLCNNTINRTVTLLGQILELAVEYGHIQANPARGPRRKLKGEKPRRDYLDSARQITALLDTAGAMDREALAHARHVPRRAMLATLVFAGLRISELVALRWRDVDLAGGWITVAESKTDAGTGRKIKVRPVLRDVLLELRAGELELSPDAYVFGTRTGKRQNAGNVRTRILAAAVERASERLQEAGETPLPALTPHGLRRTFASLLYGIGETAPVVMAEMGHTDSGLALKIYAQAMRREEGENDRLRALVNGESFGSFGSAADIESAAEAMEQAA